VVDHVGRDLGDQRVERRCVGDVDLVQPRAAAQRTGLEVAPAPGDERVDHVDLRTLIQQRVDEV